MGRSYNTLFLIQSLDGKITTGVSDERDIDKDFKEIKGIKEGLFQYYDLEQKTDLVSLNSGRVMAKIGVNDRNNTPNEVPITFVIIDNKPHLTKKGIDYLVKWVKQLILVTTNKNHPAIENKKVKILHYDEQIDFCDLMIKLKNKFNFNKITLQSGGSLNSQFLRLGLIDEVSIVIAPCLIGGKDTQSLIGGESLNTQKDLLKIKPLKLITCKTLENSYIHLRYLVINETRIEND